MPKPAAEPPGPQAVVTPPDLALFVVRVGFYAEPLPYLEGEIVEADDPYLKTMPDRFRPFAFPHPVRRRGTITSPEVRS